MENNLKNARISRGMRANEVAKRLGVVGSTVSSWEASRIYPTLDKLVALADLYGVSVDYLLGRDGPKTIPERGDIIESIKTLRLLQGKPVFTRYGWALVNAVEQNLVFSNRDSVSFSDIDGTIRLSPETNPENLNLAKPIMLSELKQEQLVFVEPVGLNSISSSQLRGTYRVYLQGGFVENNRGNRFFFDNYIIGWYAYFA